jgi:hypothetical protein
MPPKNAHPAGSRGPRPSTRAYDHQRAMAAFPEDACDDFTQMLTGSQGHGRRRRTQAQIDDGMLWFTNPARMAGSSKEQTERHWWKSTFRFSPDEECLYALPTKKYQSERRMIPEEDFFKTIVYEHDINGPGAHQVTTNSMLEHYYGPTRKETIHLLKRCLVCGKGVPESRTRTTVDTTPSSEVLHQITHGQQPLEGIPRFDSYVDRRDWTLQHLAGVCRWFDTKGYCEGLMANISLRDCEPEHQNALWMKPMGVHLAMVKSSDLVCLDMDTGDLLGRSQEVSQTLIE